MVKLDAEKIMCRFNSLQQFIAYNQQKQMSRRQVDEQYDNDKELKKNHSVISSKKRERLIELVINQNITIYRAAKRLKICHPTAKFIVKNYRLTHNLPRPTDHASSAKVKDALVGAQSSKIQKEGLGMTTNQTRIDVIPYQPVAVFDQATLLANAWAFYGNQCFLQPFYYYS